MSNASPAKPGLDAFHKERSKCIDAFAQLEEAVLRILMSAKVQTGAESFGQKIALARKLKPAPQLSKARLAALAPLLERAEAINALRNDVVHAQLKLAVIGEDQRACFVNTRQCDAGSQTARLFSLGGLRDLAKQAAELAGELGAL